MRCGQSLQKRCMPGVGRSKIQPGRHKWSTLNENEKTLDQGEKEITQTPRRGEGG